MSHFTHAFLAGETPKTEEKPWWEAIIGTFKGDPEYDAAMRLGREYRESLRARNKGKV